MNVSACQLHAPSATVLGHAPFAPRATGAAGEIRYALSSCSLGSMLIAQSDRGVCALFFSDDPDALVRDLQNRFPRPSMHCLSGKRR